jgi:hypothetical protein
LLLPMSEPRREIKYSPVGDRGCVLVKDHNHEGMCTKSEKVLLLLNVLRIPNIRGTKQDSGE